MISFFSAFRSAISASTFASDSLTSEGASFRSTPTASRMSSSETKPNSFGRALPRKATGSKSPAATPATSPTGPCLRDSPAIGSDGAMKPPAPPVEAPPEPKPSLVGAVSSAHTWPGLPAPKPLLSQAAAYLICCGPVGCIRSTAGMVARAVTRFGTEVPSCGVPVKVSPTVGTALSTPPGSEGAKETFWPRPGISPTAAKASTGLVPAGNGGL